MKLTAFSNSEERVAHMDEKTPFLLQSAPVSLGAVFAKGPGFASYVVAHRNIITGQHPASSAALARQIITFAHTREQPLNLQSLTGTKKCI